MSRFMLIALIVLLASTLISAESKSTCGRHGDPCVSKSDCCSGSPMICNIRARRCQIHISEAELWAARAKILGRQGPDQ
ncbi:PREDICTED: omega-conotoxin-like protein 1 [Ceratosolen solmsi marchali]|uniref:Omega-conotoxin-like protein 1 n=1 Tax=Ceratosolen solmsi marchali TaxID=326594 RepID=A0AAJ7DW36_9HYME|nr:PREDICTED: omega-conotoxin-like protein 1 [Ceratosolen solmsi marchali]